MRKNVIVFGLISGLIITALMIYSTVMCIKSSDFEGSMVLGYASMLVAFSFVFIGVKNFRDKHNLGVITFGKAFMTGLYITLVASTFYVLVWLVDYYVFIPDFLEKYTAHVLNQAKESGATQAQISIQAAEMEEFKEMYKNPLFVVLMTYLEVLPIGLIFTLFSALVLRRKTPKRGIGQQS